MNYEDKSKKGLIEEINGLKERIEELEEFEKRHDMVQASLWETNSFLRNILESSSAISIISTDDKGKILYWNTGAEKIFGYTSEELVGKKNIDVLYATKDVKDFALEIRTKIFDEKTCIRTEIREVTKDGRMLWINMTLTPRLDGKGKVVGILGIGEDITEKKTAQEKLQESMIRLQKTLQGTINAMVATFETKDPYTAGHQKRVADLACEIAKEMGLKEEKISELYMCGIIHDLGKISIPTEILCKPGRISEIEFNLIKVHSQVGFDILKDVEFPWPISQIILQHHERLDGSGYPKGLKGDEITKEAKILAVADVVEAMASHRPYRPALGIDIALEEIISKSGTHFDPEVVEACVKLFRIKKYELKES